MQFRRGAPWQRRDRTRPVLIATLVAIPLAVGVVVGVKVADPGAGGPAALSANQSGLRHHHHHRGSVQVGGTVMGLSQTPAQAAQSMDCTLQVPANPLSARGLATPYVLGDGCQMSNADLQAYVEADIINPRTGRIKVYNPLVITEGTQPAARPVPPRVPRGDVVGIMFGFNGDNLMLTSTGHSLQQGNCVNGLGQSLFTQVAYCNSPAFYRAANRDIARGLLKIPPLPTGNDGQPCPTTRDFSVVDQDQSDNVVTTYLLTASGQTAQDSPGNATALGAATPINNGSDNALVNKFMDPALGCTPYEFHDKTMPGRMSGSQITDELLAAADQAAPVALVPLNDPMTLAGNRESVTKTNLYRAGVDQPVVGQGQTADTPRTYCKDMMRIGMARIALDEKQFSNFASPVPSTGSNLFTFMAARLSASFGNLGCGALLNAPNPVKLTLDANGVATAASFSPLAIGTLPGGVEPSASTSASATPASATPAATPTAASTGTAAPTPTPTPTTSATQGGGQGAGTQRSTGTQSSTGTQGGTRSWHNRIGRPHHM
jgi:hypothetical protein